MDEIRMMRRIGLRKLGTGIFLVVILSAGLAGGVFFDRCILAGFVPLENIPARAVPSFRLMAEAWDLIQRNYVDRSAIQPKALTYGSISGMVEALGDTGHSDFLPPEMVAAQRDFAQGHLKGIGAQVQMKDGHVVIVAPLDGSPAQRAGLRPADIIMKVNGKDIARLSLDRVVALILGPVGTKVTLTILTPSTRQTRDVTITRESIVIHNVRWHRIAQAKVAHLRIAAFSEDVTDETGKELQKIKHEGLRGIILDLRNDPGGLLSEAIGVASLFLKGGNVLLEKDASGKITPVAVKPDGVATGLPMVVLVNQGTASASEIVAGALQDAHRATLVGQKTFGTGTVLREFGLSDGSALMLAVEEWLTPNGHTIWHKGISPDEEVALPPEVSPLFPEAERNMTPDQIKASGDVQLERALDLLSQIPAKQASR